MKKHSIFALISMGVMVFALTGCSLARTDLPDQGMEADRLIGVFLTTEYLDLFDMEGYLANHPGQLLQDGEIGPGEAAAYQRRLYADKVTRTITNEDTGATEEVEEYVFEGVQGWAYLAPALTDEAGERIGVSSSVDDALSDAQMNAAYTDEGESLTLEATLYLTGEDVRTIYVNPVYQSADERLCHQRQRLSDARAGGDGRRGVRLRHPGQLQFHYSGRNGLDRAGQRHHPPGGHASPGGDPGAPDGGSGRPDLQHLLYPRRDARGADPGTRVRLPDRGDPQPGRRGRGACVPAAGRPGGGDGADLLPPGGRGVCGPGDPAALAPGLRSTASKVQSVSIARRGGLEGKGRPAFSPFCPCSLATFSCCNYRTYVL